MDIDELLAKADGILSGAKKTKKTEKRKAKPCKGDCGKPGSHVNGFCKACYLGDRKEREAVKVGKRWFSTDGRERIYDKDGSIKLYHRWLVEQKIGRPLHRSEKVSWKDGNVTNNVLHNLILVTDTGVDFSRIYCKHCGKGLEDE